MFKEVSLRVFRGLGVVLAVVVALALLAPTTPTEGRSSFDPDGVTVAHRSSFDPNGLRLAQRTSLDPNGLRLAQRTSLDPNGAKIAQEIRGALDPNGLC